MAIEYDGQDYLQDLLDSIQTDSQELFKVQFKKWLVSLVAQAFEKDRNDYVFVLVGQQGSGKTTIMENLLWDDKWFASMPDFSFGNKEHRLLMATKVLILLDEMHQYSKASDVRQLKAGMSQSKITADKKFQESGDYSRAASFAGASNSSDFLRDDTGDRRFLVFNQVGLDLEKYKSVDKRKLWGQLVYLFKSGFDYKISQAEIKDIVSRNLENYTVHKPEDTFISEMLEVTQDQQDFLSNIELEQLVNSYMVNYNLRGYGISISTVKAKLKLLGAQLSVVKKRNGIACRGTACIKRKLDCLASVDLV
ncbi:VapE domain-containing protein [Hymenobacter cavernae]|uniref:Virulence-associated protein E-like domain-containing protein n=1 Tax=Hymenobacter cavernae TaxID=2044852 RepID=A0ABQ1UVQ3_9BACT|nr:VapE domain-containing protein [Hymenobacter cavernae]GGF26280.1 hypothetical protein GCM10011383_42250 [Hymenobacter cavernae]